LRLRGGKLYSRQGFTTIIKLIALYMFTEREERKAAI